ncbi:MAG TPA: sialidase family protein [Nitriliruptorales bacterium]|nr:sialidase family protein [Nitriliruptorales bacterium]
MGSLRLPLAVVVLSPAVLLLAGVGASAQQTDVQDSVDRRVVTAAVQVTRNPDPARAHASPQIARNPVTGEFVVAETEVRAERTCDVHVSTDDGRSWSPGGDPMLEPWTDCSGDPDANVNFWLEFDRDGVLYMAFPANDPEDQTLPKAERQRHIFLARSEDSGRTFDTTMVWEAPKAGELDGGGSRNGRTWVAVDPNDPRYVYVTWMNWWKVGEEDRNRAMLAASSDGGQTFAEPVSLGAEDESWYEPRPAVDGNGAVHVVFPSRQYTVPEGQEAIRSAYHRVSTDHGKTWSQQRLVDEGGIGTGFARKWGLEADPRSNVLYVVWYGNTDPRAVASADDELPDDDRDILVRVSTDSGRSWSEPRVVNDDIPGVPNFHPGLSIAPNGRLDVAWLDFRNDPNPADRGGLQDVFYSSSTDQGQTFSADLRISDRSIDRQFGVWSNSVDIHAPVGITSTNDSVYFVWQDSRNARPEGSAEDVYFASLKLNGTVQLAGTTGSATSGLERLPWWAVAASALLLGMGLAMAIAYGVARYAGSKRQVSRADRRL